MFFPIKRLGLWSTTIVNSRQFKYCHDALLLTCQLYFIMVLQLFLNGLSLNFVKDVLKIKITNGPGRVQYFNWAEKTARVNLY